jgi:hypothetical protein
MLFREVIAGYSENHKKQAYINVLSPNLSLQIVLFWGEGLWKLVVLWVVANA